MTFLVQAQSGVGSTIHFSAINNKIVWPTGNDSHMAGFGPRLIPDRFHLANQATLAKGVRLSLAPQRWAWACRRLWVSGAQTLSKRPDLSRARRVRTPWPPARPPCWPLRLSRVLTIIVFAASLGSLPMGDPASWASR